MNKKDINSKISKYTIALVALCFVVTSVHLAFIEYRYSIGGLIIPLGLNFSLHCVALFIATVFSAAAADAIHELSKEHDEKQALLEKEKQDAFAEKIIEGDFGFLESAASNEPFNSKLVAFISGFLTDSGNISARKAETSKYKGSYQQTLETLNEISAQLDAANKHLKEASSAINMASANAMHTDNPLFSQLKPLLNNMNTVGALLGSLAQMNIDIDFSKIEDDEKLSKSAMTIGENYNRSFSVIKGSLVSLKNNSSTTSRDIQGFSRLNREQADKINQAKNIVVNMDKQLKALHSVVFEGSKAALRSKNSANSSDESLKHIEKINASANDMAAIMKSLSQLDTQLNKLTDGNSISKEAAERLSANISEISKNTRTATDVMDKFNFKGSTTSAQSHSSGLERFSSAAKPTHFDSYNVSAKRLSASVPVASVPVAGLDKPKERRVRSSNPPLAPRPVLKVSSSNYNFDSKDYGKYSKK